MTGYEIRGLSISNYRDQSVLLDDVFGADGVATGTMVAMNAEKIVIAETDIDLRDSIEKADYRYADGVSVVLAVRRRHGVRLARIAGADLWQSMMRRAAQQNTPVFLLGGRPPVSLEVERRLRVDWGVHVVGRRHGYFAESERGDIMREIRDSGAQIVAVALGSPKQEIFMQECHRRHPAALYIGVGGSFDVVSGHVRRAPVLLRRCGMEWCYRILTNPSRWGRVRRLARFAGYYWRNRL
ncbi:WecB/TagA/CpsF family glycosyltransferase [Kineosporia babensis]|uniref:WecB/TagA/CpsF family glycosyltransferase n=1 Tax=Kineosporia babensis TaxID=499548 RepID=A0A9X1SXZ9_9ACTN|nr:WecB/TagA/CpsF family glycosyltransferase [Kineosporia babensis]MCD5310618.1 WecB/TagA/CpsF family glycosyltransferase [Kineosporia babensis]